MEIETFAPGHAFDAAFRATRFTDWQIDDLLRFWDSHRVSNPSERLLFVLDDQDQASYTSSHAQFTVGLSHFDEAILSDPEKAAYHETYRLTPERHVEVVRNNLAPLVAELSFDLSWENLLPVDEEEIELVLANRNPPITFTSRPLCLHVPVTEPSDAIIGAPNGYFAGDLTPAQNYVLAEHLRTEHGYELMGLGSFLIAFVRAEPASFKQAKAALDSIGWMYARWDEDTAERLTNEVLGSRVLVLSYRGS